MIPRQPVFEHLQVVLLVFDVSRIHFPFRVLFGPVDSGVVFIVSFLVFPNFPMDLRQRNIVAKPVIRLAIIIDTGRFLYARRLTIIL